MLIEQDRSKPIAHAEKLLVLIKKKQRQMLSLYINFWNSICFMSQRWNQKGGRCAFRAPQTQTWAHSPPTQVLPNPYTWDKGRNTIYFIHISILFQPPTLPPNTSLPQAFSGQWSSWFSTSWKKARFFKNQKQITNKNKQKNTTKAVWVLICFQKSVHPVHLKFYVCLLPTFSF